MTSSLFLQLALNSLLLAGLYGLMAVGLNLVFGVTRILNFAHGELIMLGAFSAFWVFTLLGLGPLWAVVLAAPLFFVLGVVLQRVLIEPLVTRKTALEDSSMVLTYGIALFLTSFAKFLFSVDYKAVPYLRGAFFWGDLVFSYAQVVSGLAAILLTAALFVFLKTTRFGMAIRATSQNRDLAAVCGIEPTRMYAITFGLGTAAAAAAGCIFSMLFAIYPEMGLDYSIRAFVIVIFGGMGNMAGALLGALILAVGETFGAFIFNAQIAAVVPFLLVIGILFLKPSGLLGGSDR